MAAEGEDGEEGESVRGARRRRPCVRHIPRAPSTLPVSPVTSLARAPTPPSLPPCLPPHGRASSPATTALPQVCLAYHCTPDSLPHSGSPAFPTLMFVLMLHAQGISARCEAVLALRQAHGFAFGKSDLFVVLGMRPTPDDQQPTHQVRVQPVWTSVTGSAQECAALPVL